MNGVTYIILMANHLVIVVILQLAIEPHIQQGPEGY